MGSSNSDSHSLCGEVGTEIGGSERISEFGLRLIQLVAEFSNSQLEADYSEISEIVCAARVAIERACSPLGFPLNITL